MKSINRPESKCKRRFSLETYFLSILPPPFPLFPKVVYLVSFVYNCFLPSAFPQHFPNFSVTFLPGNPPQASSLRLHLDKPRY